MNIFLFILLALCAFISFKATIILADKFNIAKRKGEPSRLGGIIFFLIFITGLLASQRLSPFKIESDFFKGIIASSALITALGLFDDFKELPAFVKLIAQILVASLLPVFGISFTWSFASPQFNTFISIIWIVLIINAINLLDIIDGLAAGIAAISLTTFLIISQTSYNPVIGIISSLIICSVFPFLFFNKKPAKIFMGDTGSMFLGLTMAVLSVRLSNSPPKGHYGILTPILIMGLPLYDISFVILQRILNGRNPLLKSHDHFCLRLIHSGYKHGPVNLIMYLLTAGFCLLALLSYKLSSVFMPFIMVLYLFTVLLLSQKAASVKIKP